MCSTCMHGIYLKINQVDIISDMYVSVSDFSTRVCLTAFGNITNLNWFTAYSDYLNR